MSATRCPIAACTHFCCDSAQARNAAKARTCTCAQAFKASEALTQGDDFFGRPVVLFIISAVAFNYALAFIANIAGFVVSVRSMQMFGTNAAAYMEAIKTIAGPSNLEAVTTVKRAIDSFKIVGALEDMDRYLKVCFGLHATSWCAATHTTCDNALGQQLFTTRSKGCNVRHPSSNHRRSCLLFGTWR